MSEADAEPLLQAGSVRAGAEGPEKDELILHQSTGWQGSSRRACRPGRKQANNQSSG
jgi:hypothetical protein